MGGGGVGSHRHAEGKMHDFVELVNHVLQFENYRRQFFIDIPGFFVIASHTDAYS